MNIGCSELPEFSHTIPQNINIIKKEANYDPFYRLNQCDKRKKS